MPRPSSAPAASAARRAAHATASIAVLPFADLSEKQDRGYLSDGLAEELIDLLTKIPELRVTARASSFRLARPAGRYLRDRPPAECRQRTRRQCARVRQSPEDFGPARANQRWNGHLVRNLRPRDEGHIRNPGGSGDRGRRRTEVAAPVGTHSFSRAAHGECPGLRGVSARPAVSRWSVGRAAPARAGRVPARRGTGSIIRTRSRRYRARSRGYRRRDDAGCPLRSGARRGRNGRWRWRRA